VTVELGQLGNYFAEIMQPDSFLHRGDFDVCLVLAPLGSLAPGVNDGTAGVETVGLAMQTYIECIEALTQSFPGLVVVCNFASSNAWLARRGLSQRSDSARYAFAEANRHLAAGIEPHPRVVVSDLDYLAQRIGAQNFFSARNMITTMQPFSTVGFRAVCNDWAELCGMHFHGGAKCIVVDCDNTLWGGIVGEDGVHGLRIGETYPGVCYQDFQRQLKRLKDLGFLLAINSKNNEADVREVFAGHPGMVLKYEDFAAVQINWNDKASNMSALAEELRLGVSSFVFVDDNPFEIELVKNHFPTIRTLLVPSEPWRLPELLPACAALDRLRVTQEDRAKSEMYAQEQRRKAVHRQASSLDDYLSRLSLRMTIEKFSPERHSQRAVQLLQKTNQFNLTTRRHSEKDLLKLADSGALIFLASLQDSFGDYGRIALAIIQPDGRSATIDSLLMSCRAIGRRAETAFLGFIFKELTALGCEVVHATFVPSERNQACAGFLREHDFRLMARSDEGVESYERDVGNLAVDVAKYFEIAYDDASPSLASTTDEDSK
jgi:FkbH-like protein